MQISQIFLHFALLRVPVAGGFLWPAQFARSGENALNPLLLYGNPVFPPARNLRKSWL